MTDGFSLERPISAWNKPLAMDFGDLFRALSKTLVKGASGDWSNAASQLLDGMKTVGLQDSSEQLGWALIHRSLVRAVFELVGPHRHSLNPGASGDLDMLSRRIELELEGHNFVFSSGFFDQPRQASFLPAVSDAVEIWLTLYELDPTPAKAIAVRLPSFFVYQLNSEWREHSDVYAPLKEAVDTPFTKAAKREMDWSHYRAWLDQQMEEPIFSEPYSLRRLFIKPRAFWFEEHKDKNNCDDQPVMWARARTRHVVDLEQNLLQWLDQKDHTDAIRLISGGPGAGKSSFCKHISAVVAARQQVPVLFVPLHRLDVSGDLVEAIGSYVLHARFFEHNPLDSKLGEERLLLILDGLDELAMSGEVGLDASRRFMAEVRSKVTQFNAAKLRLQVVVSGRDIVIGENRDGFRKGRQVLYMSPYRVKPDEDDSDPQELLNTDQRHDWWSAYGGVIGVDYSGLPVALRAPQYEEITSQPLLNLLLAMSYTRAKITFDEHTNLNNVYADLLDAVYQRGWEGSAYRPLKELTKQRFVQVLEEIALAVRHGDGRTASIKEIQDHCDGQGLTGLLKEFSSQAKTGVTSLLTAFYFRHAAGHSDNGKRFEFTHKSFGEYLTARRLVRGLKKLQQGLAAREEDYDSGFGMPDALNHWVSWTGPAPIDGYLMPFLKREIGLQNAETVAKWQLMLCAMIEAVVRSDFPMEKRGLKFGAMVAQARNAGEALLAVLYCCAERTQQVSRIRWPHKAAFGNWLYSLQGQRLGKQNPICLLSLAYLDLSGQNLVFHDLYAADFKDSDLSRAFLVGANLGGADLRGAHLRGANLGGADLRTAHLSAADLSGAHLIHADLSRADLSRADLSRADLRNTKLIDVKGLDIKTLLKLKERGAIIEARDNPLPPDE